MKSTLRKICWPVLRLFETQESSQTYKPSHRVILNVVGSLFCMLALGLAVVVISTAQYGAVLPVIVFFSVGSVALIVGSLGTDAAVSRIWSSRS